MAQRVPAGPSWEREANRCISCMCRNLVRIWSASTGPGLLVSRGSLQSPFPTTAVYWHGVLSSRVPEPVIMAWFPDRIRKRGAIRFAPIFVFIDCVPIALVPFAAWKRIARIRVIVEVVPSPVSSLPFIFFVHSPCTPFPLGGELVAERKPVQLSAGSPGTDRQDYQARQRKHPLHL